MPGRRTNEHDMTPTKVPTHDRNPARTAVQTDESSVAGGWKSASLLFCALATFMTGCAAWAPNGWNVTVYQDGYLSRHATVAAGISGPIPPMPWMPR